MLSSLAMTRGFIKRKLCKNIIDKSPFFRHNESLQMMKVQPWIQ